jgi:hypothetical protein
VLVRDATIRPPRRAPELDAMVGNGLITLEGIEVIADRSPEQGVSS